MLTLFLIKHFNQSGNKVSRFSGWLANCYLPLLIRVSVLKAFVALFGIQLQEAEKTLETYPSINAFFTRALNPQCRPLCAESNALLCPVDGRVQEFGTLSKNTLVQAKGVDYTLEQLIPTTIASQFVDGHFITYYLAPYDCHRIFSPVSGEITGVCHVPGLLYPVREPCISQVPGLYTQNERVITYIQTSKGKVAVVKVGALNVGHISTPFDPSIRSNLPHLQRLEKEYPQPIPIQKGEWLGTFHLGSTVVLIFEKDMIIPDWHYGSVQYGQKIGSFA